MKSRPVEVYIGYTDHTWDTMMVDISAELPEDYGLELTAIGEAKKKLKGSNEIAFIGVYYIPPLGETPE